ncbi:MAG: endonuclease/exonuclease/phosphatase family protein [Bacteroidia bacterium]|nr:endonuclease/exonuclease/phosphatase family protein [Bacteroidia bacterium]
MIKTLEPTKKKTGRRIGIRNAIMLSINAACIFFLFLSYIAGHISPEHITFLAIFGLAYPALLGANIFFVLWWVLLRRYFFLFSLLAVLAGYNELKSTFAINFSKQYFPDSAGTEINLKVMTYNVRLFDLYNWTHNLDTRKKIFEMLKYESPDIICFQEFYNSDNEPFCNIEALGHILRAKNYHVDYSMTLRKKDHWGIATYSTYPIIKRKTIHFGKKGGNLCLATDIVCGTDTLRIFNVHLESIRFKPEDYKLVENFGSDNESQEIEKSKLILGRLKAAFERRGRQADIMRTEIETSPYKVIVCGDFNDTPTSYAYRKISKNLQDSFIESGTGMSQTYAGIFPSFRIDYILHDKSFSSFGYEVIHKNFSDHFPVKSFITIGKK